MHSSFQSAQETFLVEISSLSSISFLPNPHGELKKNEKLKTFNRRKIYTKYLIHADAAMRG